MSGAFIELTVYVEGAEGCWYVRTYKDGELFKEDGPFGDFQTASYFSKRLVEFAEKTAERLAREDKARKRNWS